MPAAAAFDPFHDQQDEGEGDFGISALFPNAGEYADDELQHREVLESSSSSSSSISLQATHSDMEHDRHSKNDGWILPQFPVQVLGGEAGSSRTEDLRQSFCEICAEKKQRYEMIRINKTCSHSFCSICVSKHVKTRIADNQVTVPCLGLNCKHAVEFQSCVGILPQDVLDAWDGKLCESLILDAHKFYCPFRDCSATLVNDSEMLIKECECPHCNRLFCAQCRVPWHTGMSCEEFQELNEDERGKEDLLLRNLAKEKKWGRCPKCKFYVERTEGCPHMICRCRHEFCYGCGTQWGYAHAGCSRS